MKSAITLTPVSVLLHERKWMDISPGNYDHKCYVVSKAMTRMLRHDQTVHQETDGAVKFGRTKAQRIHQKNKLQKLSALKKGSTTKICGQVTVDRHTSHMPCLSTYSSSAQSAHMHIHSPREHARLKGQQGSTRFLWYVKITCHPASCLFPCSTCH